jgi:GNAT superfamily N-acetyltransferase
VPAECLVRNGYRFAAELVFLTWDARENSIELPRSELNFEPYRDASQERLIQLVESTYIDTLDAPALNGARATADVLEGYEHVGVSGTENWYFVRQRDRDVGCLLLADFPELSRFELVYMGLQPAARGRGWGKVLVHFAQWMTRQTGRQSLLLAVDAANDPARAIYARCGFQELDRRIAWFKVFGADGT